MFIKCLRQTIACVALLWAICAGAANVTGLYSAEINVSGVPAQPTEEHIAEGLTQVLIKLSGSAAVADHAGYEVVMGQAQSLLREYGYRSTADGKRWLQLSYDPVLLDALLQQVDIRGPEAQRPALLLWLVHKEAGASEEYIGADHPAMQALVGQAQRRGLALQLPLLDLQDLQDLPPEELWRQASAAVHHASQRYSPDAVLAGRIWFEGGYWFSEFEFSGKQWETQRFTPAGELDEQMTDVVDTVADRMLQAGVDAAGGYRPSGLVLQVDGIQGQADYLMLVERLRQSEGVTAVFPERLSQGQLRLRVQLEISVEQLEDALRHDIRLEPVSHSNAMQGQDEGVLQYRWQSPGPGNAEGMQ